jgi:hypothetical protein
MGLLKVLNLQGYIGIGVSVILAILLGLTAYKADHWHDTAVANANLYHSEQAAHRQTVINYQNAAATARKADAANTARVKAEQTAINERTKSDYEARIAAARARADSLRPHAGPAANPGSPRTEDVPGAPGSSSGTPGATPKDGLSGDDRLIATEQAIQLDELIKWVNRNLVVDYSGHDPDLPAPRSQ